MLEQTWGWSQPGSSLKSSPFTPPRLTIKRGVLILSIVTALILSFDLLFTLYTFGEEKSAKTFSVKGVVLGGGKPQAGVSVYAALEISPSGKFADNLQTKRVSKSYGTYQFDDLPMPDDGRLVHYRLFASVDKRWIGRDRPVDT